MRGEDHSAVAEALDWTIGTVEREAAFDASERVGALPPEPPPIRSPSLRYREFPSPSRLGAHENGPSPLNLTRVTFY